MLRAGYHLTMLTYTYTYVQLCFLHVELTDVGPAYQAQTHTSTIDEFPMYTRTYIQIGVAQLHTYSGLVN